MIAVSPFVLSKHSTLPYTLNPRYPIISLSLSLSLSLSQIFIPTASTPPLYNSCTNYIVFILGLLTPLREVAVAKHARVHGDITLPSPSAPCLFVGENIEEGLLRPFALSLLTPNYKPWGLQ